MKRNYLYLVLSFAAILLISCGNDATSEKEATATNYPKGHIDIIAGGGPGGGTDVFSRAVARELSKILKVDVNVINKPGAAGAVASQELDKRPADGYSIMPTTTDISINIARGKTQNYLDRFEALARFHQDTYILFSNKNSRFKDIDSLIKEAKENPNTITIGGTHSEGLDDLASRLFQKEADIKLNYVPYEESGKIRTDLMGNHIDLMIDQLGSSKGLVDSGEIIPLIAFSDKRIAEYPDVPTTVEKGYTITDGLDRGFVIKKDVPTKIKTILKEALEEVYNSEDYKEFAKKQELDLKDAWLDGSDYDDLMRLNIEVYKALLEE